MNVKSSGDCPRTVNEGRPTCGGPATGKARSAMVERLVRRTIRILTTHSLDAVGPRSRPTDTARQQGTAVQIFVRFVHGSASLDVYPLRDFAPCGLRPSGLKK